jgi:hypothetical protein
MLSFLSEFGPFIRAGPARARIKVSQTRFISGKKKLALGRALVLRALYSSIYYI